MNEQLIKKLNIKDDQVLLLINCPEDLEPNFNELDLDKNSVVRNVYDSVIIFVHTEKELTELLPENKKYSKKDGKLWVAYPKKSGSISSDLNRDIIWGIVNGLKLNPNKLISMNADWSIMSLARKGPQKKPSTFGQDPPGVDRKTKTVIPPDDLQKELEAHPEARTFFDSLAFSHRREYVGWIHNAKKEETRERRIKKTIELLLEGKKVK
ncbi:MAG: YdeI/OmpD-associated family protein [Balneola sp.]